MLYFALAMPLLPMAAPATTPDDLIWAATPAIARIEAQRQMKPLLVVMNTNGFGRYSYTLNQPEIRRYAQQFECIQLQNDQQYGNLLKGASSGAANHIAFATPDGELLLRVGGMMRTKDLERVFQHVQFGLNGSNQPAWRALNALAQGRDEQAQELLNECKRQDPASFADLSGAFGDEIRIRGDQRASMPYYQTAYDSSRTPEERLCWGVRLAGVKFRNTETKVAIELLKHLRSQKEYGSEDQEFLQGIIGRFEGGPFR